MGEGADGRQPLRFEILGGLRAWHRGRELDLGSGKQRAVLAVLLVHANQPVPVTQIVDAVWRDDPPENGPNVVQKYVAGLRQALEPDRSPRAPGQVLTRTEAGYLLRVTPDCLDAEVFDHRVRQARAARAGGRLTDAAAELRGALALWRGPALAGLPGREFDAMRDRMAEGRAAALETWAEIELDLGHHDQLLPELVRLVAEFPLRERLRALLMLALYRCGRQAEALAAYREVRRFLAEEFGVEPGTQLQELHQRILRSDPELIAPQPQPAAHALVAPTSPVPPPLPVALGFGTDGSGIQGSGAQGSGAHGSGVRRSAWRSALARVTAVLITLASAGILSWAVIAYYAGRRRSRMLALAAAGYFALVAVFFIGFNPTSDEERVWDAIGMLALLLAMAGGAIHAALLSPGAGHGRATLSGPDAVEALERRIRRQQALQLLAQHPALARELHLGRPDLPRTFDDGGLVDVNGVPEHVLAALPGITPQQAHWIVADRQRRGELTSVEDLITRNLLPGPVVRALSERLIVVR